MAIFCYKCPECGRRYEYTTPDSKDTCECHAGLVRDYKAESVGFNGLAQMKEQREKGTDGLSGRKAMRDLFLPTAKEMASPSDPSGEKGMREWNDKHGPRDSNKAPLYPDVSKRSF